MNAILGAIFLATAWPSSGAAAELDFDQGVDARLVLQGLAEGGAGEGAALAPGAFGELVPLLGAWTTAVIAADEQELVKRARRQVQAFSDSDNVDLIHLVGLMGEGTGSAGARSAGRRLSAFLRERMLLASSTTGNRHGNASGLAVYLPMGPVSGDYAELAWARDSGWPTFARWVSGLFTSRPGVVAAPES